MIILGFVHNNCKVVSFVWMSILIAYCAVFPFVNLFIFLHGVVFFHD